MKKKQVNSKQPGRTWFAPNAQSQEILHHFLSPIEWVAFENKFKPFNYEMNGIVLQIDSWTSYSIFHEARSKLILLHNIVRRERIKHALNEPKKLEFLNSQLEVHEFSKALLKKLNSKGILRIDQLASVGREDLVIQYRIDKTTIGQIEVLFKKHDCEDLL